MLLQPSSSSHAVPGSTTSANAARGVAQEQVVGHDQVLPPERLGHAAGVGVGREHVGAEQEQHAHAAVEHRLGDAGHLVRNAVAGRPPVLGA